MFKKLVSFIVAAAMLCSLLVFVPVTAAAQDEGTGTFTADITKNDDASWHIVDTCGWHSFVNTWKSGTNSAGTQLYCATGENKTTTNADEKYNWWVVVGDAENITADKEIKTFSLHVAEAGKDIIKVLGSSTLKGEYTEIPMSRSEDNVIYFPSNETNKDKAPNVLCTYDLEGKGFRYVKIESYGKGSYAFHDVGVWSYTYGDAVTSFEVDDTQNDWAAWNVIDASKVNGQTEAAFTTNWKLTNQSGTAVNTIGSTSEDGVERTKYWLLIGDEDALTPSRELKTFTLQSRGGSSYAHVLVSSTRNGEFVEIAPYSEKEDKSCYKTTADNGEFSAYAPKKLCRYDLSGYGAKYVKIQMTSGDWGNAGIGRWTYTYGDATNSFTADAMQNDEAAWRILKSEGAHQFSTWQNSTENGGDGSYVLATGSGDPAYWVITGGVAPDMEIKTFEVRHVNKEGDFKISASDELDGTYTEVEWYEKTTDNENKSNSPYKANTIFRYDLSNGKYRYIKIEYTAAGVEYNGIFGKWTYTWGKKGSGHFDLGAYDSGNKRFTLTTNGSVANIKQDTGAKDTYFLSDGTAYFSNNSAPLQGKSGYTSGETNQYGNVAVTLPTNVNVNTFYFDGIMSAVDSLTGIKVETSTDGETYTDVTPEKHGNKVNLYMKDSEGALIASTNTYYDDYQTWACDIPAGTKYVKISWTNSYWTWTIGKMSYDWTIEDSIEAEYAKGLADTIDAKVRVLANDGINNAVVVLAGYADDELKAVQVVNAGDITGYESFGLAVKADGVTKARAYLWSGADLTPIANFGTYTVAAE